VTGPVEVSRPQALAWRLGRQLLAPVGTTSAEDVVRRLAAIPAQSDAELAVRTRQQDPRPGELDEALRDGRLLRTFAFRGAVHLLTPAELGAALSARPRYGHLREIFANEPWTLLKALAWQGDLTFGPSRDGEPTFQLLAHNLRWAGLPDLADAGRHAIEAYVRAYGPTTSDHLQYWLGAGLSAGRRRIQGWITELDDRLAPVVVDGAASFALAEDVDELLGTEPTSTVRLLPAYDQWVLGPGTADPTIVPPGQRAVVSRGANLVVAGGVVVGTWSVRQDHLTVTFFADAGRPSSDALDEGIARLGASLPRPLGTATVT